MKTREIPLDLREKCIINLLFTVIQAVCLSVCARALAVHCAAVWCCVAQNYPGPVQLCDEMCIHLSFLRTSCPALLWFALFCSPQDSVYQFRIETAHAKAIRSRTKLRAA